VQLKQESVRNNEIKKLENSKAKFAQNNTDLYFVHSYYAELNEYTVLEAEYGPRFTASMQKDNFYGCQFHPEKSGKSGEKIMADFLKMIKSNI
jgi:glutamine amidotransferase